MEKLKMALHEHPLIPFTRFTSTWCRGCSAYIDDNVYIYGGYRCNEPECDDNFVLHNECAKPLQEINHSSHLNHPLKLTFFDSKVFTCSLCGRKFSVGYCCSVCDFKLDLACASRPEPLFLSENSYGHEHPLQLFLEEPDHYNGEETWKSCHRCHHDFVYVYSRYRCQQCAFVIHLECVDLFPEAYHSSHPQHPLMSLKCEVPDYADKTCLLCEEEFDERCHQLHHCDICNFSICRACMKNPPPVDVDCPTTHEHQLHLIPRRLDFTCNACGTRGDRSPYFCLQCNFMIHRQCIDLPRVIYINRHDHRISYTRRLGHGEWKCRVCREKVDGFYGAYTCAKCPTFAVHARCATNKDIWDMVEREGTLEEEEIAPFEVIDDNTIKHFSHEHNLQINNKDDGKFQHESVLCKACVFQICTEPFYSCKECSFILHQKCANLPRKKRHVRSNQPFTLHINTLDEAAKCDFCSQDFTGFRYKAGLYVIIDVRCGSTSDALEHESHPHPLIYSISTCYKDCSHCEDEKELFYSCDECNYFLDTKCALLPKRVMRKRYDDHPLFLSFGDHNVNGEYYWCEACETKVDPKKWFYTCNECGITLHISCLVGDFSYLMPGSITKWDVIRYLPPSENFVSGPDAEVVSNTSICRQLCSACNSRCKLPSILKFDVANDLYVCSYNCWQKLTE